MECTPGSEIIGSHQTRVTEGYKLPYVCCKSNPCPLEGQKVVLTAEPSLMPPKLGLFIPISDTYIKCFGLYLFLLLLNIKISPPWGLLFVCLFVFSYFPLCILIFFQISHMKKTYCICLSESSVLLT